LSEFASFLIFEKKSRFGTTAIDAEKDHRAQPAGAPERRRSSSS
jgi:hypothetical protein